MTNSPYLTIALDTAPAEAGEAVIPASKASEARGLTGSESGIIFQKNFFFPNFFQVVLKDKNNFVALQFDEFLLQFYFVLISSLQPETSLQMKDRKWTDLY